VTSRKRKRHDIKPVWEGNPDYRIISLPGSLAKHVGIPPPRFAEECFRNYDSPPFLGFFGTASV
jgi:hypothetical protein